MDIREVNLEVDGKEIAEWFLNRKWPYPMVANIGPIYGFIAEKDGSKYACAWVYLTGRSLAHIDWLATNPKLDQKETADALDLLIDKIKDIGAFSNPPVKALCIYTKNKSLASRLQGKQFLKEEGYQRLLWTSK